MTVEYTKPIVLRSADVEPKLLPTSAEPMRGLAALSKVALMGRDRIVAMSEVDVSYAVEPFAAAGWFVLIAGVVGGGKTTLAFLLLVARANLGEPVRVLDREVVPAPIGTYTVLLEGEVDEVATSKKLRRSCLLTGVDEGALERVIVVARKSVVVGDAVWLDIDKLIAAGLVSDIYVDTIARVMPGDANDERAQIALFEIVSKSVERAPSPSQKPIVWLIAHKRKGDGDELDDVGGSVQRVAQMDSVLLVEANKDETGRCVSTKVIFRKLRHEPDTHPLPVTISITKDGIQVGEFTRDDRPLEQQIETLLESTGPMTKTAIGKRLGRSGADIKTAVDTLFDAQRLMGAQVKTKNGTYSGIALRPRKTTFSTPDLTPDEAF